MIFLRHLRGRKMINRDLIENERLLYANLERKKSIKKDKLK